MLRKKISAGVAVLIAAQLIAVACYVSTTRTCPGRASRGTATCSFDNGRGGSSGSGGYSYPWVATGAQGITGAQSDDTTHCHYSCPDGTGFWAFPGAVTTGVSCGE
jgi:hypothetical protein